MQFKVSPGSTILLFALAASFARLGAWQLDREQEKLQIFEQFEHAPMMTIEQALHRDEGVYRVEAYGSFDPDRHILLDNKILEGRTGVHTLTPFVLSDGSAVLVNRGWLFFPPDRSHLPTVPSVSPKRRISGILKKPSNDGPRLGEPDLLVPDKWPQLVTYLDMDAVAKALQLSLEPWILQLDQSDPAGFEGRDWKAAAMKPEVHRAYAVQWFSLALATIIIWLALAWRRGKTRSIGDKPTE